MFVLFLFVVFPVFCFLLLDCESLSERPLPPCRALHLVACRKKEVFQSSWLDRPMREVRQGQELVLMRRLSSLGSQALPGCSAQEGNREVWGPALALLPGPQPLFWEPPEPSACFYLYCSHSVQAIQTTTVASSRLSHSVIKSLLPSLRLFLHFYINGILKYEQFSLESLP